MIRLFAMVALLSVPAVASAQKPEYTRTDDVIYGRKWGMCLTLDVFAPTAKPNGLGVVFCVSGGWFSDKKDIKPELYAELLNRGFKVFAVMHGSNPKFAITEAVGDMHRAIRYIRHHSKDYKIDPEKLGIVGHSAGGHLALMQGLAPEAGDKTSEDPVERESSGVCVVAASAAPTDFLNWGKEGVVNLGDRTKPGLFAPFEFPKMVRETVSFEVERDQKKREEIGRTISPVARATKDAPPVLLLHGEKDSSVPLQQAERLAAKLADLKVLHLLIVRKGEDHTPKDWGKEMGSVADWFEKHTAK